MKIRVINVRLHQSLHIGGIGEIGAVLPPMSKTISGLSMYVGEGGHLVCSWDKGKFLVGASNIIGGSIVIEEEPAPETPTLRVVPKIKEPKAS